MTLQGLNKYLDKYDDSLVVDQGSGLELLKALPFYDWSAMNKIADRPSTFNHVICYTSERWSSIPII